MHSSAIEITDKKVALVTGAGRGIGKAIAERLARDGFAIGVNDVIAETAETTAAALRNSGAPAMASAYAS